MIPWNKGEPEKIEPGMLLHYKCGLVELVGSQRHVATGPIQAWYPAVKGHWIDWVSDLANRKELGT
jgi:hypothetical protein